MNDETTVYDLGEITAGPRPRRATGTPARARRSTPLASASGPREVHRAEVASGAVIPSTAEWIGSFSLILPGAGQFLQGRTASGLCFLSLSGLAAALAWSIVATLDRLAPTLDLLGFPPEAAVWALCALLVAFAFLHTGNVLSASVPCARPDGCREVHPFLAGAASLVFPGWGQLLRGNRIRAALFVCGVWVAASAWLLASPPVRTLLEERGLFLPTAVAFFVSPAIRWTLPAVIWALAVYDAAARSSSPSVLVDR